MVKKFFQFLHTNRHQLSKYVATGGCAFLLDIITLILFKEKFGLHPAAAVALNQVIVLNFVFFSNKYWSFGSRGQTKQQLMRFITLMLWNYIFSISWLWLWVEVFQFNFVLKNIEVGYIIGRLASVLLQTSWNFLLYKFWVYKNALVEPN